MAGCSGGTDGQGTGSSAGVDITGTWTGTWSSRTGVSGAASMRLVQGNATLDGDVTFSGSPCFSGGAVGGTLNGRNVSAALTAGAIRIQFTGTVSDVSFDGTYRAVEAGACSGDTGTFTFSR